MLAPVRIAAAVSGRLASCQQSPATQLINKEGLPISPGSTGVMANAELDDSNENRGGFRPCRRCDVSHGGLFVFPACPDRSPSLGHAGRFAPGAFLQQPAA